MRNNRRKVKQLGYFVDICNVAMSIAIIVMGIILAVTGGEKRVLFPIVFGLEGLINILAGIKQYKSNNLKTAIFMWIAAIIMLGITVFAAMVVAPR